MEIGPSKPGGFALNEPTNRRSQKEEAVQTNSRLEAAAASAEAGRARLTGAVSGTEEPCSAGEIGQERPADNDRLHQIRQRIETGYYDQFSVKEKMIDKMIDEMLKNISEFYK